MSKPGRLPSLSRSQAIEIHTADPYEWLNATAKRPMSTTLPQIPSERWCLIALSSEGDEQDPADPSRVRLTPESRVTIRIVLTRSALRQIFEDNGVRTVFYTATRSSVQKLLPDTPLAFNYTD